MPAARHPRLLGLATAAPPHVLAQDEVARHARAVFGARRDDFARLEPIFHNTGIVKRHAVAPLEWYLRPQDWPSRSRAYVEGALALYREAATGALEDAGLTGADVDTLVTVSTTGIATPSLEARLLAELGFRDDVKRVPVFGFGCAGGVSGLSLAARLAAAAPGETVLMVAVELCTLAFRLDELDSKSIVATALFADGAAAAVVSTGGRNGLAALGAAGEHTWPDTLDIMGWSVDASGFGVVLSRALPAFIARNMRPALEAFLERHDLAPDEIDGYVFHPGGTKVLAALETAFDLDTGALSRERAVLAEYGNMSAPTVLFVLRRLLDEGGGGRYLMSALGPGFTASLLACEV